MKRFKIVWKDIRYGESLVTAENEEEAREKAEKNEDEDFEELDPSGDWEIDEIIEIEEEDSLEDIGIDLNKPFTFEDQEE